MGRGEAYETDVGTKLKGASARKAQVRQGGALAERRGWREPRRKNEKREHTGGASTPEGKTKRKHSTSAKRSARSAKRLALPNGADLQHIRVQAISNEMVFTPVPPPEEEKE
eukprot:scaffold3584_cov105-Pinguiococcus_pyrenoidosus.AAC.1